MNPKFHVRFEKMVYGGDCMGRLPDGRAVFVPFVLPGECAEIELTESKERFARGRLVTLLQGSPERVQPACPYFSRCGGCSYQHIAYTQQLKLKKDLVIDQLQRIGKLSNLPPMEIVPSPNPFAYRNQVQFHPAVQPDGTLSLGFKQEASDQVLPIENCLLASPEMNDLLRQLQLEPDSGIDRVVLREDSSGELMLVLEGTDPLPPDLTFELALSAAYTNPDGEVFSLSGNNALLYQIEGEDFVVSPPAFFQINLAVAAEMVRHLRSFLTAKSKLRALELYCGVGLFTRFLAPYAQKLTAIESSPSACFNFVENLDEFDHISLYEGAVEEILPGLARDLGTIDLAVLDPPRAGLNPKARQALISLRPDQICYISCDPSTLARDLKALTEAGYSPTNLRAFDMFPQTSGVETMVLLQRF